ncbi:MAG: STAS domain-containing protein [Chromatiaceae bacterium]|nr:STAS domain-containing protein [Chromatiaceae bacterium]
MNDSTLPRTLLEEDSETLIADWLERLRARWHQQGAPGDDPVILSVHLNSLHAALCDALNEPRTTPFALDPESRLARELGELVHHQTRQGASAEEVTDLVSALKPLLMKRMEPMLHADPAAALPLWLWLDEVFERLLGFTFAAFIETRERIITQQSLSLLELSTPVLRLWHQVLLLPLVGVVDTARARHFTERLLESVARYEALVTIIDVTGVPVLDTSVARHLMKTIDAARLLGTRIVMTGISPEGAQTLTKLGISFSEVTARASLRAGIAEALSLIGRRIAPLEQARP